MSASPFFHHLRRGTLATACGKPLPSLPGDVCVYIGQLHDREIRKMWASGHATNVMGIDLTYTR